MEKKYVWSVATGCANPFSRKSREAVDFIKTLDGFVGVHPAHPNGTLWFFDSKNNAKGARNLMEAQGILTGRNICRGWIDGETLHMECVDD